MGTRATQQGDDLQTSARRTLLERRNSLLARLRTGTHEADELLGEREPDWEDRAANVTAANRLESIVDNERVQLAMIQAALVRLEAGTWGRCVVCGKRLSDDRLRAAPEAARCPNCTNHTSH
jgi:RNA polymerase-binding transcription factor DksA